MSVGVRAGEGSGDDPVIRSWLKWVKRLVHLVKQVQKAPPDFKVEHRHTLAEHGTELARFESYIARRGSGDRRIHSVGRQLLVAKSWLAVASHDPEALTDDPTRHWCGQLFNHRTLDLWELFRVAETADLRTLDSPPPNVEEPVRYARVPVVVTAEDGRAYRLNLVLAVVPWPTHGNSPCIEHPLFSLNARTTERFAQSIAAAWRDAHADDTVAHAPTAGIGIWSIHPHFNEDVPVEIREYWCVDDRSAYGAALLAWSDLLHHRSPSTQRLVLAALDDHNNLTVAHLLDKKITAVPVDELSEILVWDEAAANTVAAALRVRDPHRRIAVRWIGDAAAGRSGGRSWTSEQLMTLGMPSGGGLHDEVQSWAVDPAVVRRRTRRAWGLAGVALAAVVGSGVLAHQRTTVTPALALVTEFKEETYPSFVQEKSGFEVVCSRDRDHLQVRLAAQTQAGWGVCCAASSTPVDLSRFKAATVRLDNHTPGKEFEIKLEQADSSGAGQRIIPAVLTKEGPQNVKIPLESFSRSWLASVKRVCFSTTAEKMQRPPLEVAVDVQRVTFE